MISQSEKYQIELKKQIEYLNYDITDNQIEELIEYMRQILKVNKNINLTRIVNPIDFIQKHLIDSLTLIPFIEKENKNIIDIGTGGGFPGVPLAIVFPKNSFVLMDSTAKKLKVIESIVKDIGISNITMVHARAENASKLPAYRDHFDYAVSRAVAQLNILAEFCLPYVKVGGRFIAYKGEPYYEELENAKKIINLLGGQINNITEYSLPEVGGTRVLIDIIKKEPTPTKFPRKFVEIKK